MTVRKALILAAGAGSRLCRFTARIPKPMLRVQGTPILEHIVTGLKSGDGEISGSIAEQTEQIFVNLRAILEAAGSSLERLVKTSVFLVDLGEFAAMNEVYARHVGDAPPARSTVEIAALPSGAKVEIDAIAEL